MPTRKEQDVFDDLAKLCASPGYAHAIAHFCFRDNVIKYSGELKGEDYAKLYSDERLIRTEISTLIGLMLRAPRDLSLPSPEPLSQYIERSEALLTELHLAMSAPMFETLRAAMADPTKTKDADPFSTAEAMREPIFYGAESAYSFQYRDLAARKYARDSEWLSNHKGFSPEHAREVVSAVNTLLADDLFSVLKGLKELPPEQWTLLPGFEFSCAKLAEASGLPVATVKNVVEAFSFPDDGNPSFTSLHDFNAANAYPIIRSGDDRYILFQYVSLTEALYETPFYWMGADKAYEQTAMAHRGLFTEEFTADRLEHVFGAANVFRNVDLWKTAAKKEKLGEIDVLVVFGDRAIVVQAKSKRLTLLARKGNDQLKRILGEPFRTLAIRRNCAPRFCNPAQLS